MIKFCGNNIYLKSADALMILTKTNDNLVLSYVGDNFDADDDIMAIGMRLHELDGATLQNYIFSCVGDGNHDETLIGITGANGNFTYRFVYQGSEVADYSASSVLPESHGKEDTLKITYSCLNADIKAYVYISCFKDAGVFAFATELENNGETVTVNRLLSAQLSFYGRSATVTSFDGGWAKERSKHVSTVNNGVFIIDSKCGYSSSRHNPFVMTKVEDTVIATNLVWSGNHKEIVEVTPLDKVTIMTGMNDFNFNYTLNKGEKLRSPEGIVCARKCEGKITADMHTFVMNHIVPERFKDMERPIIFNNWEATYFDFNEEKLLKLADMGASLGVELFVLDDGWFGDRNTDKCGLGDWFDNEKKTGGLKNLKKKINERGLKFGLWFEPEMVCPDSDLYRAHPEFAMQLPNLTPLQTRHQYILDFANPVVCDYIVEKIGKIIAEVGIDYIKWDCNRTMTDVFSPALNNMGEYYYRYMVGLYSVIDRLTSINKNVLFEGCSSGGNRFDLGILRYMPQTWCSDNTDARDRSYIQEGTLYAYPQSTMGAHVSICPNHQSGYSTSIENRFNVVSLGAFGYEMDFNKCTEEEREIIKEQIKYYKEHRRLLQFGKYYRLGDVFNDQLSGWIIVSEDKSEAMAFAVATYKLTNGSDVYKLKLKGLDDNAIYQVSFRKQKNRSDDKEYVLSGSALNKLPFDFGNIFSESDRWQYSNSIATRLVYFKKVDKKA